MVSTILFPSSFFEVKKVDEDLKKEYDAALSTGLFRVILFGYNQWFNENRLIVKDAPEVESSAVYRGWMMKPEQYEQFYSCLLENRIRLVTTPEQYNKMHIFPNVYSDIEADTVKMELYPLHQQINVEELKTSFSRFMVKDYVKSVKGTEFPRFFDQDVTQIQFDQWMEVFYKYRGELLTGGICIKEYVDLKRYGDKTNEYRVFYINHEVATISRNSGQGNYTPTPPQKLVDKYRDLDSPYYTIDYAELEDGKWVIIEAGDGGVSGLSEGQDHEQYYRALYQFFQ